MQSNFWADSKNFDKAQNILRPVKGQGITLLQEDLEAPKISIPFFYSKYKSQCYQNFKQTAKRSIAFKEFKFKKEMQKITFTLLTEDILSITADNFYSCKIKF